MSTLAEQLADALNGLNNAAASTVSAPVDAISWGLRKAGLGNVIGQAPVGGSDWMRAKGLTRPTNGLAGDIGEFAGNVLPIAAAAKAPQIANGLLKMGENALAPSTLGSQRGAIVYHGSPHTFDAFDMSKIGTGEGAQAYGHGLYFAEHPDVATGYQKALSQSNPVVGGDVLTKAIETAQLSPAAKDVLRNYAKNGDVGLLNNWAWQGKPEYIEAQKFLKQAQDNTGSLYKVDLPDEAIAKMLDWDKPLSQQPSGTKEILSRLGVDTSSPMSAEQFYAERARDLANGKNWRAGRPEVSTQLNQAGIPGIKYLDQGSRGAGDGTRNYVVFSDSLPKILERNGKSISEQFAEKWK